MAALVFSDSVWFNATSTGLGDFVVAGAISTAYRTPATAGIANGSTIHYSARTATEFENGEGVYTTGTTTLSRVTIFASSNANAKVNFLSIPSVAITPLAEDGIFQPASSTDSGIALWNGTTGNTLKSSSLTVTGATVLTTSGTTLTVNSGAGNAEQRFAVENPNTGGAAHAAIDVLCGDGSAQEFIIDGSHAAAKTVLKAFVGGLNLEVDQAVPIIFSVNGAECFRFGTTRGALFAAGSATASSWPKLTPGTVLTTPEDGAIELDANCFYMTTDAGNRGVVAVRHFIRAATTRTFTSNTSAQNIFTNPANGRITLETGLYRIRGVLTFSGMSATTGNLSINLLGSGTAVATNWMWHVWGVDSASATAAAEGGTGVITSTSPASAVLAATGVTLTASIDGTFEVTGSGTMVPQITMVTAAASVLGIGSFLTYERMGATGVVSVGQWD